jgi:hypothetical protein
MKHIIQPLAVFALLGLVAPLGACGGGDETNSDGTTDEYDGSPIDEPADFCDALAQVMCAKLSCYTAEERAARSLPATEEECVEGVLAECSPEVICDEGLTYQPDMAGMCIDEIESLTCEDTADSDLGEPGPSCIEMCQ